MLLIGVEVCVVMQLIVAALNSLLVGWLVSEMLGLLQTLHICPLSQLTCNAVKTCFHDSL